VAAFDVSVIGELNLDLILCGLPNALELDREHLASELNLTLGSSSAIFAHNLALLGNHVSFSSSIGSDPLGDICIQRLRDAGVDLSRVRRFADKATGLTVILPQEKGRFILTYPGTMFEMSESDLDLEHVFNARHLHVSSYFLQRALQTSLPRIFQKAKEKGLTTSLDTNDDPDDRWPEDIQLLLPHVDILFLNEREACKLTRKDEVEQAAEWLSVKVRVVAIKRGSAGALVRSRGEKFSASPPPVAVVDTVGAGDSFDAGFLHQFLRGRSLEDCLRCANIAGALSTTRAGGTEAFRDRQHREAFLEKHAAGFQLRSAMPSAS